MINFNVVRLHFYIKSSFNRTSKYLVIEIIIINKQLVIDLMRPDVMSFSIRKLNYSVLIDFSYIHGVNLK
jgi:hypothetical protein